MSTHVFDYSVIAIIALATRFSHHSHPRLEGMPKILPIGHRRHGCLGLPAVQQDGLVAGKLQVYSPLTFVRGSLNPGEELAEVVTICDKISGGPVDVRGKYRGGGGGGRGGGWRACVFRRQSVHGEKERQERGRRDQVAVLVYEACILICRKSEWQRTADPPARHT